MLTRPLQPPVNPGAGATAVVHDNGFNSLGVIGTIPINSVDKGARETRRCVVTVWTDVGNAVLRVEWQAFGSANLRLVQADVPIPANTFFERSVMCFPGRTKISIVTVTAPTTWEVSAELTNDQALSQ